MSKKTGETEKQPKKGKAGLIIILVVLIALGLLCGLYLYPQYLKPVLQYNEASKLFNAGQYAEAEQAFLALGDYRNSSEVAKESRYMYAMELVTSGQGEKALPMFESLGLYGKSTLAIQYIHAMQQKEAGDTETALNNLRMILDFHDSRDQVRDMEKAEVKPACDELLDAYDRADYETVLSLYETVKETFNTFAVYEESPEDEMVQKVWYARATALTVNNDYTTAYQVFAELGDYADSAEQAAAAYAKSPQGRYEKACSLETEGNLSEAIEAFHSLDDYLDSDSRYHALQYQQAVQFYENKEYSEAASCFEKILSYEEAEHYWQLCKFQIALLEVDQTSMADALVTVETSKMNQEEKDEYGTVCYKLAELYLGEGDYARAFNLFRASEWDEYEKRMEECNQKYLSEPVTIIPSETIEPHIKPSKSIIDTIVCQTDGKMAVFTIHLNVKIAEVAKGFQKKNGFDASIHLYPIKSGAKFSEKAIGHVYLLEKDKGDTITMKVSFASFRNYRTDYYFALQINGNYYDEKIIEYSALPTTDLYGNFIW